MAICAGYNGYLTGVAIALFQYGDHDNWKGLVTLQVSGRYHQPQQQHHTD